MIQEVLCDTCGSSKRRILFGRARNDEAVSNVICLSCGTIYVSPRDDDETLRKYYLEGAYSLHARGGRYPSQEKYRESESSALQRFQTLGATIDLRSMPCGRMLEIGCGVGSFLRLMRDTGWEIVGLEPDSNYARSGEERYNVTIHPQTYEETELPEEFFDMVASFHVIEHVTSPRNFLEKVSRELKVNGVLYLETPCIERPSGGNLERFFWKAHLYTFSKRTLSGLLNLMGFQVISSGYSGDFLWVVAKRVDSMPVDPELYPLDDPYEVWHHTHRLHREFQAQMIANMTRRIAQRALDLFLSAIRRLRCNSDDLIPTVARWGRSWKSHVSAASFRDSQLDTGRSKSGEDPGKNH